MAVTMKQVRAVLDPDEPDYERGKKLGPDAVRHLKQLALASTADPLLAGKATYLAGLIGSEGSAEVVRIAAHSANPAVRVAAAGVAGQLKKAQEASDILIGLTADEDEGVCKVALRSVGPWATTELQMQLEKVQGRAVQPSIRQAAKKALLQAAKRKPQVSKTKRRRR